MIGHVTLVWVAWPGLAASVRLIAPTDLGAYLRVPGLRAVRRRAVLRPGLGRWRAQLIYLARYEAW